MDVISIGTALRYSVQGKSYAHVCAEARLARYISVRVCTCTCKHNNIILLIDPCKYICGQLGFTPQYSNASHTIVTCMCALLL